jgi:hypothetical protein
MSHDCRCRAVATQHNTLTVGSNTSRPGHDSSTPYASWLAASNEHIQNLLASEGCAYTPGAAVPQKHSAIVAALAPQSTMRGHSPQAHGYLCVCVVSLRLVRALLATPAAACTAVRVMVLHTRLQTLTQGLHALAAAGVQQQLPHSSTPTTSPRTLT